jgi:hypothetical protein
MNLELEVARANANAKATANVLYANVVKGMPSFTKNPPHATYVALLRPPPGSTQ